MIFYPERIKYWVYFAMALPKTYRWVTLGKLKVRNQKFAPEGAPIYNLADLIAALRLIEGQPTGRRSYLNDDRRMWCEPIAEDDDYFSILFQVGDKNISDIAFIDFDTGGQRDSGKLDSEGGHYCAHVLVAKHNDTLGRHLVLAEKVPGVHLGSIRSHFNWALRDIPTPKAYPVDGVPKIYKGTTEVDGYQSKTVMQVMTSGTVLDVQFVGHQTQPQGSDEDDLIREKISEVKWGVGRQLSEAQTSSLMRRSIDYLNGWTDVEEGSRELLVRVKSDNGQIKTTAVNPGGEDAEDATQAALSGAFQLNEVINNFATPLTQRYSEIRVDVVDKMKALVGNTLGD
jgi:hypothetical protein